MADRIAKTDLKILIVDDSADAVNSLKDFLREQGFNDNFATPSGKWAINTLKNGTYVPHLAIVDTEMEGGVNGFETLRQIMALESYSHLPIIGASANHEYEENWMRVGADAFFLKTYSNYGNLGSIIQKVFENRGTEVC